jgi:hypothetical protein
VEALAEDGAEVGRVSEGGAVYVEPRARIVDQADDPAPDVAVLPNEVEGRARKLMLTEASECGAGEHLNLPEAQECGSAVRQILLRCARGERGTLVHEIEAAAQVLRSQNSVDHAWKHVDNGVLAGGRDSTPLVPV